MGGGRGWGSVTANLAERRILESMPAYDPERVRLKIVEPGADLFAAGVLEMLRPGKVCEYCKRGSRKLGWYRLFAKVAKLVDAPQTLVIAIWSQLGVRDEGEARALIGLARSVDGLDKASVVDMSRKLLEAEGWTCTAPGRDAGIAGDGPRGPVQANLGAGEAPAAGEALA